MIPFQKAEIDPYSLFCKWYIILIVEDSALFGTILHFILSLLLLDDAARWYVKKTVLIS